MQAPSTETIRTQLAHRTIRAFTTERLPEPVVDTLMEVARHAPTSSFYQQTTIIRITDPATRHEVYEASGQPYVDGTRGELFVFVIDLYRNARIREAAGVDTAPLETTALFLQGAEDTLLAAQNVVVAAESLGLGTVYLGSIAGDPARVIQALDLPERTYPLVGMLIGYPDQSPQLKPRLPRKITQGVNRYPSFDAVATDLSEYDSVVTDYYDLRDQGARLDSFTHQIRTKLGTGRAERSPIREVLTAQKLALR